MTQQHWLAPATEPGVHLDMRSINQVVDYPFRDMTITVQAGMTVHQMKQLLKEQKQCLPIDVPDEAAATVGGSIAANLAGPRAAGWGSWRDYLIGLSWLNDQGKAIKAGGRVVKNVAGYDFCKLFVGSLGTLGVITEVTLKVKPQPEKLSLLLIETNSSGCHVLMQALKLRQVYPVLAVWNSTGKQLTLGFEDNQNAVNWQVQQTLQAAETARLSVQVVEQEKAEQHISQIINRNIPRDAVHFAAKVPRGQALPLAEQLVSCDSACSVQPLTGLINGELPAEATEEQAVERINALRQQLHKLGGILSISSCPAQWRVRLLPFGTPRPEWKLMRKIKQTLDPHDLFQRNRHEIFLGE